MGRRVVGVGGDTTSDESVRQAMAEAMSLLGGAINPPQTTHGYSVLEDVD